MIRLSNTIYILCLIVTIAINFAAIGQAAEMKLSSEQQKIWGLVESYWESAQNGDLENLMNSLHEKYVFWPQGYTVPYNKSEIEFLFGKWLTHNRLKLYELNPRAIQVIKNVAVIDNPKNSVIRELYHRQFRQAANYRVCKKSAIGGREHTV